MKREPEYEIDSPPLQKRQIDVHHNIVTPARGELTNYVKNKKCIELLHKKGVKSLFPIQYCTFEHIMKGRDIIARDRTGSGKTLAFSLPVILRMRENRCFEKNHLVKFLIVLPTRELTMQVKDEIESLRFKDQPDFRVIAVYGKSDINYQIEKIKSGIDIIVATPGRLIDLLEREVIRMNEMQVLCLDQADEMLKQGFKEQIEKIYKYIKDNAPKKTQNLLFSATIPPWLQQISQIYLDKDRQYINLIRKEDLTTPATLTHYSIKLTDDDMKLSKSKVVVNLINKFAVSSGNVIIFCERKADAMTLSNRLNDEGKINQALHGDVPQFKRQSAYRKYKQGQLKILVATNVAARGLDFPDIDLVIQVEPPNNTEPYIHRSGRTARKGKEGCCVTMFTSTTERYIKNIEREAKIDFKRLRVQDFLGKPKSSEGGKYESKKGNHNEYDEQIELYVKYIPKNKSGSQIREYFESKKVNIRSLKLLKDQDGNSKGCAFIKFSSNGNKERCLQLDGELWEENRMSISEPSRR